MICFIDVKLFLEVTSLATQYSKTCSYYVANNQLPLPLQYLYAGLGISSEYHIFFYFELYDFCLQEKIADQNLIAKWKKQGYENLCCLRCIQTRDTNFGTSCICRVPKSKLEEGRIVECVHCGCRGCSG